MNINSKVGTATSDGLRLASEAGHFALDTARDEIAALVRECVSSSRPELLSRRAG